MIINCTPGDQPLLIPKCFRYRYQLEYKNPQKCKCLKFLIFILKRRQWRVELLQSMTMHTGVWLHWKSHSFRCFFNCDFAFGGLSKFLLNNVFFSMAWDRETETSASRSWGGTVLHACSQFISKKSRNTRVHVSFSLQSDIFKWSKLKRANLAGTCEHAQPKDPFCFSWTLLLLVHTGQVGCPHLDKKTRIWIASNPKVSSHNLWGHRNQNQVKFRLSICCHGFKPT